MILILLSALLAAASLKREVFKSCRSVAELIKVVERTCRKSVKTHDDMHALLLVGAELSLAEPTEAVLAAVQGLSETLRINHHLLDDIRNDLLQGVSFPETDNLERLIDAELTLLGQLTFRGLTSQQFAIIGVIELGKHIHKDSLTAEVYDKWTMLMQLIHSAQRAITNLKPFSRLDSLKREISSTPNPLIQKIDEWSEELLELPSSREVDSLFEKVTLMKKKVLIFGTTDNLGVMVSSEVSKFKGEIKKGDLKPLGELALVSARLRALGENDHVGEVEALVRANAESFMAIRKRFLSARKTTHALDSSNVKDEHLFKKYLVEERDLAEVAMSYVFMHKGTEESVLALLQASRFAVRIDTKSSSILKEIQSFTTYLDKLELQLVQMVASRHSK